MSISHGIARVKRTRIARSLNRYSAARGGLLAGGIAYSGLFSIAAALTIGLTVFMGMLGKNADLRAGVLEQISQILPGVISTPGTPGLLDPDALVLDSDITPASVIAAGVLLWTVLSTMRALSTSIRAMFGLPAAVERFYGAYLRAAVSFIVLCCGVAGSSVLSVVSGFVGASAHIVAIAGGCAVDVGVVAFIIRILAGVRAPLRDLLMGSGVAAIALTSIRELGTSAVASVTNNPLLLPFAAIITVLLWLNLASRVVLISAAFTANPPHVSSVTNPDDIHARQTPNYVTISAPETLSWAHNPVTGVVIPEPESPEDLPHWGGRAGRRARRKVERARQRAHDAVCAAVVEEDRYMAAYEAQCKEE